MPASADRRERLGLIGIDLHEYGGSRYAVIGDAEWPPWITCAVGRENLWFSDEIGGHLWLYAEVPEMMNEVETNVYLRTLARQIRDVIALRAGNNPLETDDRNDNEGGIGYTKLTGWSTRNDRDVVYDGVIRIMAQMKATFQQRKDRLLHEELEKLLRENSLQSVYQPIVRLGYGDVFGYEALSRCPENCLFDGPLALFKFAEQNNQAFALDRLVREKAIRNCPSLGSLQKIFINVTMGIMNDPHFVSGQTVRWLTDRGLHPDQVVFELTERNSIDDFEAAKKILGHYRNQGYEIAIDDAGAGYSSLQSIVELSPDYIKIDRSLVRHADSDDMKKNMLSTFVRFAKKMNIRTVAEGIERPEEMRLLCAMGFDFGQGFWIGRPSEQPVVEEVSGLLVE